MFESLKSEGIVRDGMIPKFFRMRIKMNPAKTGLFTGHKESVYNLQPAGKNDCFFSAAGDGLVVRWELSRPDLGQPIARLRNSIYALFYEPAGRILYAAQNFEGLFRIEPESGKIISAKITDSAVFDLVYHRQKIFSACGDGTICVSDATDLQTLKRIKVSEKSVRSLAVLPENHWLAAGYSDNRIRIFDVENLKLLYDFEAHKLSVFCLTFSPCGRYLLSGSRDAHLKIWDTENDFALKEAIVAHMYTINHIAYSPDARFFATCSKDKSVKIWDAENFKLLKVIDKGRYAGHATSVNRLLWTGPDSLLSASDDRTISAWNLRL